jgi:two-component system phosphate regulon sensor histidine kinase PhoR
LNKRKLYIAIFITTIFALFIVQYQYLKIGLNLAKVQFNRNIGIVSQNIKQDLATENQLSFLVGSALIHDESYFDLSMDSVQDASKYFLNDFITYRLSAIGIDTDFTYRLFTRDSSFYLKSPRVFKPNTQFVNYPIELEGYLPNLVKRDIILELQFKDLNSYFLWQLNGLTIPSLLCIVVIIVIFVWVLKSVYWQHKVITTTNAFINNLTHELKTPVFSIGLATKILEDGLDPKKQQFLTIIRQQLDRLNQHIDKVLELGKLEFEKNIFNLKTVDFKPNLIQICEDFDALSALQDIQFTSSVIEETIFIKADVYHLENAIGNILDNAQKYSESPIINLKTRLIKNQLFIIISDNGIGISQKEKKLIFKKYYRVSNGNLHKVKGYGLGLSYVKEVINKHRGKVKIDSNLGQGTTVTIVIPLVHDSQ